MVRANTIETQGKSGSTGDVGGIYLVTAILAMVNRTSAAARGELTSLLAQLAYRGQNTHPATMLQLFPCVSHPDHVRSPSSSTVPCKKSDYRFETGVRTTVSAYETSKFSTR